MFQKESLNILNNSPSNHHFAMAFFCLFANECCRIDSLRWNLFSVTMGICDYFFSFPAGGFLCGACIFYGGSPQVLRLPST